jgi:trk system potassium uptake protein TrkH
MTAKLSDFGKLILIVTMFTGRVGLLTLAFALARPPKPGELVYAEESVMTG